MGKVDLELTVTVVNPALPFSVNGVAFDPRRNIIRETAGDLSRDLNGQTYEYAYQLPLFKNQITPTCSLTVPSILTVPNATLNQFVLTGKSGANKEAKGTSFNVRINCATSSTSFTPTVTFSYVEGLACMPGNGWATAATAAQGIGYAIKTSVTGSNASDYICGNSGSGTNVVSFPATTANAVYDQSKTFFVNYAIQGSTKTTGIVQTSVTLTATFN